MISEGFAVFGVLFPALFFIALATFSIIAYEALNRMLGEPLPEHTRNNLARYIDSLSTIATLTGSLQTIISLCIVGFSMWSGTMQIGTKAFALLIQGFASTGFGIAVAIIARIFLQVFHHSGQGDKNESHT